MAQGFTSGFTTHTHDSSQIRYVTVVKTANYTAADDSVILCDATSAGFTITLPSAASSTSRKYEIKKTDSTSNVVTVDANASETIDGSLTKLLESQYQSISIVSDGSNWFII